MNLSPSFPQLSINLVRLRSALAPEEFAALESVFRTLFKALEELHILTAQVVNANAAVLPNDAELFNYSDDSAAAAGGVALYSYYRTGSIVKQRIL